MLVKIFEEAKAAFFKEREASIKWLNELKDAPWQNGYDHPKAGRLTAQFFYDNWLAHDYFAYQAIVKTAFLIILMSQQTIHWDYAGVW